MAKLVNCSRGHLKGERIKAREAPVFSVMRKVSVAGSTMEAMSTEGSTAVLKDQQSQQQVNPARPHQVVVWNDPVNLMSYVAWVFRSYFGHSKERAQELMLQVHTQGKAVVASGTKEKAERDVTAMHSYGLQATVEES